MCMKIKLARVEKKITQKELAKLLSMSPNTINKIELGKTDIRDLKLRTLLKITEALDISLFDLLEE